MTRSFNQLFKQRSSIGDRIVAVIIGIVVAAVFFFTYVNKKPEAGYTLPIIVSVGSVLLGLIVPKIYIFFLLIINKVLPILSHLQHLQGKADYNTTWI